jgi:hypothetical protein
MRNYLKKYNTDLIFYKYKVRAIAKGDKFRLVEGMVMRKKVTGLPLMRFWQFSTLM